MRSTPASPTKDPRIRRRSLRAGAPAVALIAIELLVSGCGGGSTSSGAPDPSPANIGKQSVAFGACMRSHGVPGYPDPQVSASGTGVQVTISPGTANPDSPAFKTADRGCHHLLPGLVSPATSSGQEQQQDLKFADCMRSHGVPGFPDADRHGSFTLPSTIDQRAPQFQRATKACMDVEPSSLSILNQTPGAQ